MLLVCQSLDAVRAAMRGVEEALARGALAPERVNEALGRIQALRRLVPPPAARPARIGWPAHGRLARRLAAQRSAR